MNARDTKTATGDRTNRRRQSPARSLGRSMGRSLGRLLGRMAGFPPDPQRGHARMHIPSFAASWPRLAIG
jgi:hypothetical protein